MDMHRKAILSQADYMKESNSWLSALSPDEQYAAYSYVDAGFMAMNTGLHGSGTLSHEARLLQDALDVTEKPSLTVYRGARRLPEVVDGIVTLRGFTSTTADPCQVHKFTRAENPIVLEIATTRRTAVSAAATDYNQGEREFLLSLGGKYLVDSVTENVTWSSEYEGSSHIKTLSQATVINLTQIFI